MRNRLVELIKEASIEAVRNLRETTKKMLAEKGRFNSKEDTDRRNIYEVVADYLLADGWMRPPCKVGDKIYLPWEFDGIKSIAGLTVTHVIFDREHDYVKTDFHTDDEAYYDKYKCGSYEFEDFGKTVFLTREEAEQALRKEDEGK